MWCDEINLKYRELAAGSPWWFHASGDQAITRDQWSVKYDLRVPPPARDDRQVSLTLQLLNAYYQQPDDFADPDCHWAGAGYHPLWFGPVRAFMLKNIVNPAGTPNPVVTVSYFQRHIPTPVIQDLLKRIAVPILSGANLLEPSSRDVFIALCEIIILGKGADLDLLAFGPLWLWATGLLVPTGVATAQPPDRSTIRSRSFAIRALGAIINRKQITVTERLVASIEKLAKSIQALPAAKSSKEEGELNNLVIDMDFLMTSAQNQLNLKNIALPPNLVTASGEVRPEAFMPPGTRPPKKPISVWVPIGFGFGFLFIGLALVLRRRGRSVGRALTHPRRRS